MTTLRQLNTAAVRSLRARHGYHTQQCIADAMGLHRPQISAWDRDGWTDTAIDRMLRALELTHADFIRELHYTRPI